MSEQAQELTPAERKAYERACIEASERFSLYDDCTLHIFRAGLAARAPVQVERPDEVRAALVELVRLKEASGERDHWTEDERLNYEIAKGDAWQAARDALAARLPERPDEDPMPVFTIQGKDLLAAPVITYYQRQVEGLLDGGQAHEVELARQEIEAWQKRNPDRCKYPDHRHVPVEADR